MMKIGYARCSTSKQEVTLQLDALKKEGCERIVIDEGWSGSRDDRPEMEKIMNTLVKGDTLVAWSIDRWGRDLAHLVGSVKSLVERGVEVYFIKDRIDTSTASGNLTFHLFAALAEFERARCRERTKAGIKAKVDAGKKWNSWKIIPEGYPMSRSTKYRRIDELNNMEATGYITKERKEAILSSFVIR